MELEKWNAAREAIEVAGSIDELKDGHNKWAAFLSYSKSADESLKTQNLIAEIKIRYEMKMGEMLKKMDKATGNQYTARSHDVTNQTPTLSDLGINKMQSHRYQIMSDFNNNLDQHIKDVKEEKRELTSVDIYRESKRIIEQSRNDEIKESYNYNPPDGKYRTVAIDPPWPIGKIQREVDIDSGIMAYPTMTLEEIFDFPIDDFCEENCHLFMWTTQKFLPISFEIIRVWNFNYIFTMVWHKNGGFQPFNLAQYNCEFCLFARRGSINFLDLKDFKVCFNGERRGHSQKPVEFYKLIERVSPANRIDIFSRETYHGFDSWGNEKEKFDG